MPSYWIRPAQIPSAAAGLHRFVWDLHYAPPAASGFSYPIAAVYRNTPRVPQGPWVLPGTYTVRLSVNGERYAQPLRVKLDPRVKTPAAGIAQQFALAKALYDAMRQGADTLRELRSLRARLRERQDRAATGALAEELAAIDRALGELEGAAGGRGGRGGGGAGGDNLTRMAGEMAQLYGIMEGADAAPTSQAVMAIRDRQRAFAALLARWTEVRTRRLPSLDARLRAAGLAPIGVGTR